MCNKILQNYYKIVKSSGQFYRITEYNIMIYSNINVYGVACPLCIHIKVEYACLILLT